MSINRLFLLLLVLLTMNTSMGWCKPTPQQEKINTYMVLWKEVNQSLDKGLVQTASSQVDLIYQKAKKEKQQAQLLRAILHKASFVLQDDDGHNKRILYLKKEFALAPDDIAPILASLVAEAYMQYYYQNSYLITTRTEITTHLTDDITTWDKRQFIETASTYYKQSLHNPTLLKTLPLDDFSPILSEETHSEIAHQHDTHGICVSETVYDLLIQRIGQFIYNETAFPEKTITIPDTLAKGIFSPNSTFLSLQIDTVKNSSLAIFYLAHLQHLLSFYMEKNSLEKQIETHIDCIKWGTNFIEISNKNQQIKDLYKTLIANYSSNEKVLSLYFELANIWYTEAQQMDKPTPIALQTALSFCQEGIALFPQITEENNCITLKKIIEEKQLALTFAPVNEPEMPFIASVSYKNTPTIYFSLIRLDSYKDLTINTYDQAELFAYYLKKPRVAEWEINLPNGADLTPHRVETDMPALTLGHYMIIASSTNEIIMPSQQQKIATPHIQAFATFSISHLSPQLNTTPEGTLALVVRSAKTGKPLPNITTIANKVTYDYPKRKNTYTFIALQKTNNQGEAIFSKDPAMLHQYIQVLCIDKKDTLPIQSVYTYERALDNSTYKETFLYTDRGAYKPGQKVYYKGITIEGTSIEKRAKSGDTTIVSLYDANYQLLTQDTCITNEYGSFTGEFTLPLHLLNGSFSVRNEQGQVNFMVSEYKRPSFEITFPPQPHSYSYGDTIQIKGTVQALAGYGINATIRYRVIKTKTRWGQYDRFPSEKPIEMYKGITTSTHGHFMISFLSEKEPSSNPFSFTQYQLICTISDANGETYESTHQVLIGQEPISIQSQLPEQINVKYPIRIPIEIKRPSTDTTEYITKIYLHNLQAPSSTKRPRRWETPDTFILSPTEFGALFPLDEYKQEGDPSSWPMGELKFQKEYKTLAYDTIILKETKQWPSGNYLLQILLFKGKDTIQSTKQSLVLFNEKDKQTPDHLPFWVHTNTTELNVGDTLFIYLGSAFAECYPTLEIEQQGEILHTYSPTLLNKQISVIPILITKKHIGGFSIHTYLTHQHRLYQKTITTGIEDKEKKLEIQLSTFRDKLTPGAKEEWHFTITDYMGKPVQAEVMGVLYDSALDAIQPTNWRFTTTPSFYPTPRWQFPFNQLQQSSISINTNVYASYYYHPPREIRWFSPHLFYPAPSRHRGGITLSKSYSPAMEMAQESNRPMEAMSLSDASIATTQGTNSSFIRKNFAELGFFFPIKTTTNGKITYSFTLPETITRWQFKLLAHTKNLASGYIEKQVITQKEVLIKPDYPRFVREGDTLFLPATIINLTQQQVKGSTTLRCIDVLTQKDITKDVLLSAPTQLITLHQVEQKGMAWQLVIPANISAIAFEFSVITPSHKDGEIKEIPVLKKRIAQTVGLPIFMNTAGEKTYSFAALSNSNAQIQQLTVEYVENPYWYIVQALPSIAENNTSSPIAYGQQLFINNLAAAVIEKDTTIKHTIQQWKNDSSEALLSNLLKNQELKKVLIQETPFLNEAQQETIQKQQIIALFDSSALLEKTKQQWEKLINEQLPSGGWSWQKGMPESTYITTQLLEWIGYLSYTNNAKINALPNYKEVTKKAITYIDRKLKEDYQYFLKHTPKKEITKKHIGRYQIDYLYARSFFMEDIAIPYESKAAYAYYLSQAQTYWSSCSIDEQAKLGLFFVRTNQQKALQTLLASLNERSKTTDEMGQYWVENKKGMNAIETQALLLELYRLTKAPSTQLNQMMTWLIKNKQTNYWGNTTSTAVVCASLLSCPRILENTNSVTILLGNKIIHPLKKEQGTGYIKKTWTLTDTIPSDRTLTIQTTHQAPSWGGIYLTQHIDIAAIEQVGKELKIEKKLYIQERENGLSTWAEVTPDKAIKQGEKVLIRLIITTDRPMDYVHMQDIRGTGIEPSQTIPGYTYQQGNFFYIEPLDQTTNFYIPHLYEGKHVFEYEVFMTKKGHLSAGVMSLQSLYAPEFISYTQAQDVVVD